MFLIGHSGQTCTWRQEKDGIKLKRVRPIRRGLPWSPPGTRAASRDLRRSKKCRLDFLSCLHSPFSKPASLLPNWDLLRGFLSQPGPQASGWGGVSGKGRALFRSGSCVHQHILQNRRLGVSPTRKSFRVVRARGAFA